MYIISLVFQTTDVAPIVAIIVVPPHDGVNETAAGMSAPSSNLASAPAGEATNSDAAAKTGSRVYYHVDVFDPAETVAWLIANGYGDYVITTDPKPHKGMLMKLLKAGYEIPGSRLAASDHSAKNDAE